MSFFSSNHRMDNCPGPIKCNPVIGLCEKTCIQTKKVFDACIKQLTLENQIITLYQHGGGGSPHDEAQIEAASHPSKHNTFISARSSTSQGIVHNLSIDCIDRCKNLSRVKADVEIPLDVCFVTGGGHEKVAKSKLVVPTDVILCLPEPSIIPFSIEAVVSCVCPEGKFVSDNKVCVDACITLIIKVVIEVELLVPSYGYCPIPPCQDYSQEICASFFELPLFPKSPCCKK